MNPLLTTWHDEHVSFGRLLAVLEAQMDAFRRDEEPSYDLLVEIVDYLRHFADVYHHPREDAAFRRLLERDPDLRPRIERLLHEHRVIAQAGAELLTRLQEARVGAMQPRAALESAAATYLVYYRHHIATEERELLPLAASRLDDRDWAAVRAAAPAADDPLRADAPGARFAALRREIAAVGRAT